MAKRIKSKILTVMFLDLVGYTNTTTNLTRERVNQLHDLFDYLVLPSFSRFDGDVIKKIGDAFLVTFLSPTDALLCSKEIQQIFFDYNKQHKNKQPLKVRIALHMGEVIYRYRDIYGDTVNLASRVEGITKPNHTLFTEQVYNAMNKNEIPSIYIGRKKLKGIKQPIRLFRIRTKQDILLQKKKARQAFWRKIKNKVITLIILVIILFLIYLILKTLMPSLF